MVNLMTAVIIIPIALILIASLGGVAISTIFGVNQDNWDAGTVTVWNLLPLIAIVGIFIAILGVVGLKVTGKI